jgi:hypothetical protein
MFVVQKASSNLKKNRCDTSFSLYACAVGTLEGQCAPDKAASESIELKKNSKTQNLRGYMQGSVFDFFEHCIPRLLQTGSLCVFLASCCLFLLGARFRFNAHQAALKIELQNQAK